MFLEELKLFMPNTEFLIGGPHIAPYMNNVDYYLSKPYIDVIVQGEGEEALVSYLTNADNVEFVEPINNVIYKRKEKVITGSYISNVLKLDEIPVPDYSDFDLTNYLNKNGVNVFASRGCPNKCVFCSERNYFSNFKFRKADVIFNDIKELMRRHANVFEFNFADSISNASIVELEKLCDLIIEADLDIHLIFQNAVIRKEMRTPIYEKLKAAGCTVIGYGMESPNPILLEGIGKTLSKNVDIGAVIKEGTDAGIEVSVNIMFGLPGETKKDFDLLMDFLKKHKNDIGQINPAINFCALYPGSFGSMEPEKWGIELHGSSDYWEIKDDNNTYLTRLDRFEKFTTLAKEMGLDNLFGIEEITNKDEMVGLYYFHKKDYKSAQKYLENIPKQDISMSVENALSVINSISTIENSYTPDYLEPVNKTSPFSIAILVLNADFLTYIDNIKELVQTPSFPTTRWKRRVRKISHRIFNRKKYEKKFIDILSLYSSFQKEHIIQSNQISNLLENFDIVGKARDKKCVENNTNIDLMSLVLEFKKNIINEKNLLDKIAGYDMFVESMVEIKDKIDIVLADLQFINEKLNELKNLNEYTRQQGVPDTDNILFMCSETDDFGLAVKESIVNIFRERESTSGYDKFIEISEQMFGLDQIKDTLAMIYRFLYILNQQNKVKINMLHLIDEVLGYNHINNILAIGSLNSNNNATNR